MADETAPATASGSPQDQAQLDIEGFLEPSVSETPPELVGGQPVSQLPPEPRGPRASSPPPAGGGEDQLSKALKTIETLSREVENLKGRQPQVVYQDRGPARDNLPEMVEVMPGRYIPKDPGQRAIKLRAEDLVRAGWNEDPAAALNVLANAFYHQIAEVIPALTLNHLEERGRFARAGENRQATFFNEYSDLREFPDLANIVEQQAMAELPMQGMSQGEWNREVGTRVRQRIAAMRGISLEQYMASLSTRPNGATPRPRAVTGPPSGGTRPTRPANDQQREMDDLIEGRLG